MAVNAAMDAWQAGAPEEAVLEPNLPIIDAHHHLWDRSDGPRMTGPPRQERWLLEDILWDIQKSGHNVVRTVYVQAGSFYRMEGLKELRPVGETEFVQRVAQIAETRNHKAPCSLVGSAIVGTVDLRHPQIAEVLRAHMQCPNFVGIRMNRRVSRPVPADDGDPAYERGMALMEEFGLSFDCWQTSGEERDFQSVPRVTRLAQRYPKVTIILNHLGCPVGPTMTPAELEQWKGDIKELASSCPNVVCKVGGIQMPVNGFGLEERPAPLRSEELFKLVFPFYRHAIESFGPRRCMFESNFPVDKDCVSYRALWNAFKLVVKAMNLSAEDKIHLFHDTAARTYKLPTLLEDVAAKNSNKGRL